MTSPQFTSEHLGQSQFYFWYGQVLGDWEGNENDSIHKRNDIPGWGKRYKVAILGRDQRTVDNGASNDQLAMAEVALPVTAGAGLGGGTQTPNIAQNTFCIGFYKDGINCREPIILGLLPNFTQTKCVPYSGNDNNRFNPATGFNPANPSHITPDHNTWPEQSKHIRKESNDGGMVNGLDVRNLKHLQDGSISDSIPKTYKCDQLAGGGELAGIAKIIQDAMNLINRIRNEVLGFTNAITSIQNTIQNVIGTVQLLISNLMKVIIQKIRSFTINTIDKATRFALELLPPNMRYPSVTGMNKGLDILNCVFNKLIAGLMGLIGKLLNNLLGGSGGGPVNAGMCAAENFVGGALSNILGPISDGIGSALSSFSGILGAPLKIAGKVLDVLDMVFGFLSFISCEEQLKCPSIDQWSLWYGVNQVSEKVNSKVGTLLGNIASGGGGGSCSSAPVLCGPPTLNLTGGGGSGFAANPIISATGTVLGFDILNPGSGYTSTPYANFGSNCGVGNGAVLLPQIGNLQDQANQDFADQFGINQGFPIPDEIDGGIGIDGTTAGLAGPGIGITAGPGIGITAGPGGPGIGTTAGPGGTITPTPTNSRNLVLPVIAGGTEDGIPVTVGLANVTAGGNAGIPLLTSGGVPLTAGGLPVLVGASGGTILRAGGSGGTQVTAGQSLVSAGSTNGSPLIFNTLPVTAGDLPVVVTNISRSITTPTIGIVDIIVIDSGVGYLPQPNGSTGGGNQVFSTPTQTIVYDPKTDEYQVFAPCEVISIEKGELIYLPAGSTTELYNENGDVVQNFYGLGQTTPIKVEYSGTLTVPCFDDEDITTINPQNPTSSDGSYLVVLTLKKIVVTNSGINYNNGDKIVMTPNNGAELRPIFDDFGRLISVSIIKNGIGFTERPNIYIDSDTGINAIMAPVFDVIRVGDLPENQDIIPPGTEIINVIDCVGRVS